MVLHLSKEMSARLLKHVVRCYLRLSDNPRYMSFYLFFFSCFFLNLHLKCRPGTPVLPYLWKKWHICLILIWVKIQAAKSIPSFVCVVFSSPEPTAQVSFSDQNLSVVRRCSWCRRKLFILTNLKNHLLQNHGANFNQTWQKASLGEGGSSLLK